MILSILKRPSIQGISLTSDQYAGIGSIIPWAPLLKLGIDFFLFHVPSFFVILTYILFRFPENNLCVIKV